MKVSELISILNKYDEDSEVVITKNSTDGGCVYIYDIKKVMKHTSYHANGYETGNDVYIFIN